MYQNMLSFDISELYRKYIRFDVDLIDTIYGKYHLSIKTINEIKEIMKHNYK